MAKGVASKVIKNDIDNPNGKRNGKRSLASHDFIRNNRFFIDENRQVTAQLAARINPETIVFVNL